MAKRVLFSFHYQDVSDFRANVVRNHWLAKDDRDDAGYFDKSIWEDAEKKNEIGLKRLINGALENTSTTCILSGSETYNRTWVRYEIMQSVMRGNRVFAVHINQIKGKDGKIKTNGPNPLDYLALKYSTDGKTVEVFEAENGKWISYIHLPGYTLKNIAPENNRGKLIALSKTRKIYCWSADDGYNNFATWVG